MMISILIWYILPAVVIQLIFEYLDSKLDTAEKEGIEKTPEIKKTIKEFKDIKENKSWVAFIPIINIFISIMFVIAIVKKELK